MSARRRAGRTRERTDVRDRVRLARQQRARRSDTCAYWQNDDAIIVYIDYIIDFYVIYFINELYKLILRIDCTFLSIPASKKYTKTSASSFCSSHILLIQLSASSHKLLKSGGNPWQ